MVYYVVGENEYAVREKYLNISKDLEYTKLNTTLLYGDDISIDELRSSLDGVDLFSPRKLVILKNPTQVKGFIDVFEDLIGSVPDSVDFIIVQSNIDKRSSFYRFISKQKNFYYQPTLSRGELINWITKTVSSRGGTIKNAEAIMIIDRLGDNQLLLSSELAKILLLNKDINASDIEKITEPTLSGNVFNLLNEAFNFNSSKAIKAYETQRKMKVEPVLIVGTLTWQLTNLAIVSSAGDLSDNQIIAESGITQNTLYNSRKLSRNMSRNKILSLISRLNEIDYRSKTSSYDLDEALKNYILAIS